MKKYLIIVALIFISFILISCDEEEDYGSIEATHISRTFLKEEDAIQYLSSGQYNKLFSELESEKELKSNLVYHMVVRLDFLTDIINKKNITPRFNANISIEGFDVLQSNTYETSSGSNEDVPSTLESGEKISTSVSTFSLASGKNTVNYFVVVKLSPKIDENSELDIIYSKVTISFSKKDPIVIFGEYQDGNNFTIKIVKDSEENENN